MATFRSGVKILGQVSRNLECKPYHLRSCSDDRRTILRRQQSPGWRSSQDSRTPLQSTRSWFSLFRRKKSPENKIVQQESCHISTPEDDSWLSFFKKKISKEKHPPLACCHSHQAQLRKDEEEKALAGGQESEGWKSDELIVSEESKHLVDCKPPPEPQAQPPPQPTLPQTLEVNKEDVNRTPKPEAHCDSSAAKSVSKRLPYEEYKIPITSKLPPPDSSENLQPRRQSPFTTNDKFSEGSTFQQYKQFHKNNCLEKAPQRKSTNNKTIISGSGLTKTNGFAKSSKSANRHLQSSCTNIVKKDKASDITDQIIQIHKPKLKMLDTIAAKQTSLKKTAMQYGYHSESNQLLSKTPQPVNPNKDAALPTVQKTEPTKKAGFLNDSLANMLESTRIAKAPRPIEPKEMKLTLKLSSKIIEPNALLRTPEVYSKKEMPTAISLQDNTSKNKIPDITARKISNIEEKIPEDRKYEKVKTQHIKTATVKIPLEKETKNVITLSKLASSPSVPNVNKYNRIAKVTIRSVKSSPNLPETKNEKNKTEMKVSDVNLKAELPARTTKQPKTKESWQLIKNGNVKAVSPKDEAFISAWKENHSCIGFPRKTLITHSKAKAKLSPKGTKEIIQPILPSRTQPFVRPNEGMKVWSQNNVCKEFAYVRKQIRQSLKKTKPPGKEKDEPWFIECQKNYVDVEGNYGMSPCSRKNTPSAKGKRSYSNLTRDHIVDSMIPPSTYAKILGYGNRSVLDYKFRDSVQFNSINASECKNERFSSFSLPRSNMNNEGNLDKDLQMSNEYKETPHIKTLQLKKRKESNLKNSNSNVPTNLQKEEQELCTKESLFTGTEIPLLSPQQSLFMDSYDSSRYADNASSRKENFETAGDSFDYFSQSYGQNCNSNKVNSSIQDNSCPTVSSNTNPLTMMSTKTTKDIPFSYEKSYAEWCTLESGPEGKVAYEELEHPWQGLVTDVQSTKLSFPKTCTSNVCLQTLKCMPNKIVKCTFSSYVGDPAWYRRGDYKCQDTKTPDSKPKDTKTQDSTSPDSSDTPAKKKPAYLPCEKRLAPGCKAPQFTECKSRPRTHPPCDIRPAPMPSYSECLKASTPPPRFTECKPVNVNECPSSKKVKSYDGCAMKDVKEELVCPEKPKPKKKAKEQKKKKAGKEDVCDAEGNNCADAEPFKFKSGYSSKILLQRASPNNFMAQQNQPIKRSYSLAYVNSKPIVVNEKENEQKQSMKRSVSYSVMEPCNNGTPVQMQKRDDSKSSPPTTDRKCRKISQEEKKDDEGGQCVKLKAPGCKAPENIDCKGQAKQIGTDTCTKIYPPQPSFSECIRDPPPEIRFNECREIKGKVCPDDTKVKHYDGCNPPEKQEIPCPPQRPQPVRPKPKDCDQLQDKCDAEPQKWGMPSFSKSPMKCSNNHLIQRSYSYFNLNSPRVTSNESRCQYSKASASSITDPPSIAHKSNMECSSRKKKDSGPPSTDRQCRKLDSGIKKDKKPSDDKTCDKHPIPGCKVPTSTDCRLQPKSMEQCKKRMAPKKSYSECIRPRTKPRPFTECKIQKFQHCPDQKPKVKNYDGCAMRDHQEEIVCPVETEKPKKEKKNKKLKKKEPVDECDKEENCSNVEPFKFKSGYSKPPMICSSIKRSSHNLPPVRSYSDLKTEITKLPFRATSFTDCQINDFGKRTFSDKAKSKKSKYEQLPCPEDPDPPCKPKEKGSRAGPTKCRNIVTPEKHFIECPEPPKKKVFQCEQPKIVIRIERKKEEAKLEPPPKPKTFIECPKPKPKRAGSPCDVVVKPKKAPPPKKVCAIKDKHFIECLKPKPKVQPTCEQPLQMQKKKEIVIKPAGICRGDHLIKTFIECPEPPPRKKKSVCDGPYLPRMKPCFGKVKKGEESKKKCGVDPDDTTPACPEKKKKDEKRKCSQYPTGSSTAINFPPRSAGSTMKYSTANTIENTCQDMTKKYNIPAYFANKAALKMMNSSAVKATVNLETKGKIDMPAMFSASGSINMLYPTPKTENADSLKKTFVPSFSGNITAGFPNPKPIEITESLKRNSFFQMPNSAVVNFSTTRSNCKDTTCQKKEEPAVESAKCDSEKVTSVFPTPCKQPPQKPNITCDTIESQVQKKEPKLAYSETAKELEPCPKECGNADGAIEDLLTTIKSWFSFLKAREGCPEPGSEKKLACEPICKVESKETQQECLPKKTQSLDNAKFKKVTMPGCKVPESVSCSKRVKKLTLEGNCKKVPAPKPSFSECTKELLHPSRFSECYYTASDAKCKKETSKPSKPSQSACEIYLNEKRKTGKSPQITPSVELNHHAKSEDHNAKLSLGCQPSQLTQNNSGLSGICQSEHSEISCDQVKRNFLHRILSKKSKLPECQEHKSCKPKEEMKECGKTEESVNPQETICKPPDPEVEKICKIQKIEIQATLEPKKATEEKTKGSATFIVERVCELRHPQSQPSAPDCKTGEKDKTKDFATEPFKQPQCSTPTKRTKSSCSSIENARNETMLCSENFKVQKRSSSTSQITKELGCIITNKNVWPLSGINIDELTESNKRKEEMANDSYLSYIKKFPGLVGKAVGSNYLTDLWSFCQKDLPTSPVLKIADPVYPRPNPKLDLPQMLVSSLSKAKAEGENGLKIAVDCSSASKVSQRETLTKELSSVEADPYLSIVEYIVCITRQYSVSDLAIPNSGDKSTFQFWFENAGFKVLTYLDCLPKQLALDLKNNADMSKIYVSHLIFNQAEFLLFSRMAPGKISNMKFLYQLDQILKQYSLNMDIPLLSTKVPILGIQSSTILNSKISNEACKSVSHSKTDIHCHTSDISRSCCNIFRKFLSAPIIIHSYPRYNSSKSFCDKLFNMFLKRTPKDLPCGKKSEETKPIKEEGKKPEEDQPCTEAKPQTNTKEATLRTCVEAGPRTCKGTQTYTEEAKPRTCTEAKPEKHYAECQEPHKKNISKCDKVEPKILKCKKDPPKTKSESDAKCSSSPKAADCPPCYMTSTSAAKKGDYKTPKKEATEKECDNKPPPPPAQKECDSKPKISADKDDTAKLAPQSSVPNCPCYIPGQAEECKATLKPTPSHEVKTPPPPAVKPDEIKHLCPRKKEKPKPKADCPEKVEVKKDTPPVNQDADEIKCDPNRAKKTLTKEDIEARKKSFKVTELSPIKNPPPLPPCEDLKPGSPPPSEAPPPPCPAPAEVKKSECLGNAVCPPLKRPIKKECKAEIPPPPKEEEPKKCKAEIPPPSKKEEAKKCKAEIPPPPKEEEPKKCKAEIPPPPKKEETKKCKAEIPPPPKKEEPKKSKSEITPPPKKEASRSVHSTKMYCRHFLESPKLANVTKYALMHTGNAKYITEDCMFFEKPGNYFSAWVGKTPVISTAMPAAANKSSGLCADKKRQNCIELEELDLRPPRRNIKRKTSCAESGASAEKKTYDNLQERN